MYIHDMQFLALWTATAAPTSSTPLTVQVQRRTWLGSTAKLSLYHRKHTASDFTRCFYMIAHSYIYSLRQRIMTSKTVWTVTTKQNFMNFPLFIFLTATDISRKQICNKDVICNFFYVLLTVQFSKRPTWRTIFFLFYNTFITVLYMFSATSCSSSGGQIVLMQHLVSSLSVSGRQVYRTATYRRWRYQM